MYIMILKSHLTHVFCRLGGLGNRMMQKYLRTEAEGADTIIWLASSKGGGEVSGRYFFDRKARWTNLPFANTEPDKKDYQALVDFVEKAM